MKKWTIDDSKELYNINGWGTSYFNVNEKGDVYVTPCKDNTQINLRDVMDEALTLKLDPENYDARANVMWAGTLAHNGLCGVGKEEDWASHRLEHEISAFYGVAHGAGLAVMIPAWMEFCASRNPDKLWRFAINVMSVNPAGKTTDEIIDEGISNLINFYHDLGLVTSLPELIGKEPDIDMMVKSLERNVGKTLGCYVPLSMDDCREIYRLACREKQD